MLYNLSLNDDSTVTAAHSASIIKVESSRAVLLNVTIRIASKHSIIYIMEYWLSIMLHLILILALLHYSLTGVME